MVKLVRAFLCSIAIVLIPIVALAQPYPSKPIRWVVPYSAGAFADVFARKLAASVAKEMGVTIIVDNKPGASGLLGATEVAKAAPDGYTFLYTIADPVIATTLIVKSVPYDTFKDFTPITKPQIGPPVLAVSRDNPARDLRELIARAKTYRVTYGSFGPGSFPQTIMEQLAIDAGVKFEEIPYRNIPNIVTDMTANVITVAFTSPPTAKGLVDAGRARILAVAGPARLEQFPDVPTIKEFGYNSLLVRNPVWSGLFGPANLPSEIVEANLKAIHRALEDPSMVEFAKTTSISLLKMAPDQFRIELREEYDAVSELVRKAGIKASDQ